MRLMQMEGTSRDCTPHLRRGGGTRRTHDPDWSDGDDTQSGLRLVGDTERTARVAVAAYDRARCCSRARRRVRDGVTTTAFGTRMVTGPQAGGRTYRDARATSRPEGRRRFGVAGVERGRRASRSVGGELEAGPDDFDHVCLYMSVEGTSEPAGTLNTEAGIVSTVVLMATTATVEVWAILWRRIGRRLPSRTGPKSGHNVPPAESDCANRHRRARAADPAAVTDLLDGRDALQTVDAHARPRVRHRRRHGAAKAATSATGFARAPRRRHKRHRGLLPTRIFKCASALTLDVGGIGARPLAHQRVCERLLATASRGAHLRRHLLAGAARPSTRRR